VARNTAEASGYPRLPGSLYDHSSIIVPGKSAFESLNIIQTDEVCLVALIERSSDGGVVGKGDRSRCPSVESVPEGQHPVSPCTERGQFECIFVGLGPRVTKEEAVFRISGNPSKRSGKCFLEGIDYGVGVKSYVL
jgi:hypothetical protein